MVLAKSPTSGTVKTRLSPPCAPQEAAALAWAALEDTLEAVAAIPGVEPIVVLEGERGSWMHPAFEVLAQRGRGLDERLAAAFDDAGGPALLIGMDTPQVTPDLLTDAMARLDGPGVDAVLGQAVDGGYWAIGLRASDPRIFLGVPMSTPHTGAAQRARLDQLELVVVDLAVLRDVDELDDVLAVAAEAPDTRFAATAARLHLATSPRLRRT